MSQSKPASIMAAAFAAAGWKPPSERLMARAGEAWGKYPGAGDSASRRSYVAEILANDMTWLLMQGHNPPALTAALEDLLRHAADAIAAQAPKNAGGRNSGRDGGGGQGPCDAHDDTAPSTNPMPRGETRGGGSGMGQKSPDTHVGSARPAPSITHLADRQQAAMRARISTAVRLSKLDTFIVNGQRIGDLTPAEAVRWASSRERDARFVRLLTANLPPDRPIREFIDAATADDLYQRAENAA